ncbi:MAG: hypothetical protein IJ060_00665 [Oscillospiraceae bacterium]|nr:hypothetical protein [Oscillospiraceae bacterium]
MTVVFYAIFFFALTVFITWHTGKYADDKGKQRLMFALALVMSFGGIALALLLGIKQSNDKYYFRYIGLIAVPVYYLLCGIVLEAMLGIKRSNLHAIRMPAVLAWCVSAVLPAVLPVLSVTATPESGLLKEGAEKSETLHFMLFGEFVRKSFSANEKAPAGSMAVYLTILIPLIVIPVIGAVVCFVIPDRFFIWANTALMGAQCAGMLFIYTIATRLNDAAEKEAAELAITQQVDFSMGLGFLLAVIPMCLLCAMLSVMTGFYTYDRAHLSAQPVIPAESPVL